MAQSQDFYNLVRDANGREDLRHEDQSITVRVGVYDVTYTVMVEVLLYVHRNRRFIRDGSPGRPPRLSHSS